MSCSLFKCGGHWGLLDGGAPLLVDSSFCYSSGSLLLSLPLRPCLDPFSQTLYSFWASPIAADGCVRRHVDTALRAVTGWERGTVALERGNAACRCVVVVRERGKVGGSERTVVWRERGSTARERGNAARGFRRRLRALLITTACHPLSPAIARSSNRTSGSSNSSSSKDNDNDRLGGIAPLSP